MPDWAAVAHLPSCKIRRILHRWSVEVPRAIMPNRQRTMHSFHTAAGARVPSAPAPLPAQAAAPEAAAPDQSRADGFERTGAEVPTQHAGARAASQSVRRRRPRHVTAVTTSARCPRET